MLAQLSNFIPRCNTNVSCKFVLNKLFVYHEPVLMLLVRFFLAQQYNYVSLSDNDSIVYEVVEPH